MRQIGSRVGALAAALVLVGSCIATAATFRTGSYEGTTSQGLPISFTVTPTSVEDVYFGWRARCADGHVHTNAIILGGTAIRRGRFSVRGLLTTGGRAHVVGRLSGSGARGRLSRWAGSAFNTDCVARGIGWHAHLASDQAPPT
jgi:hypothetical protein